MVYELHDLNIWLYFETYARSREIISHRNKTGRLATIRLEFDEASFSLTFILFFIVYLQFKGLTKYNELNIWALQGFSIGSESRLVTQF